MGPRAAASTAAAAAGFLLAYAPLEAAWLTSGAAKRMYWTNLAAVQGAPSAARAAAGLRAWAAALCYAVLLAGAWVFVVRPAAEAAAGAGAAPLRAALGAAALRGALFGLAVYGVYNLTNLATLPAYSARVAAADTAWGALALAAGAAGAAAAAAAWGRRK